LASLMERMTRADVEERRRMGEASRQIVARWTPGLFAEELFRAIALGKRN